MVKFLAIDDEPDNLITLAALLKKVIPDCSVITAHSGKGFELGADAFFTKPIHTNKLVAQINVMLRMKK